MPDENGITLAEAKAQLAAWMAADAAVAAGQAYRISAGGVDRQVTRADAAEITNKINYWQQMVIRLGNGGIRVRGVEFQF